MNRSHFLRFCLAVAGAALTGPGAAVARSPADGYTLLMGAVNNFSINQYVFKDMPYDPFGFTPITLAVDTPQVIVVNAKVPVNSLKDLIHYAKSHQVDLGSQGIGTTTQIALGMLNQAGGVNIQHVPYKGAGAVTPAVLSGEVQVAIAGLPNVQSLIKSGALRALAVTSQSRMSALPDVPTTVEAGFPSVVISNWFGLVAPGGLNPAIVEKLHDAAAQALKVPSVVKTIEDAGMVVVASTPGEMDRRIRDGARQFAPVIEAAGIVKQ